jgi:peptide deformylase
MAILNVIIGMHPIFKQKAQFVEKVDESIRTICNNMVDTMNAYNLLGIGANMVGILKKIIVVYDKQQDKARAFINPKIIWHSEELVSSNEESLSFPNVEVLISRFKTIELEYTTIDGNIEKETFNDLLSCIIQHELDYLNGKTIFDHLSPLKRDTMIRKMNKHIRLYPPHLHTEHCRH